MTANNIEAEVLLSAWGCWNRGNASLDYPRLSVIGRVIEQGPGASHTTIPGEPDMSPAVQLVERFILTLKPPFRYAINHRYIYNSPDNYAAKRLHCSPDIYRNRLDSAAELLEKYLVET